ncbi:MAG TPA: hypothetical protein VIY90_13655 [Steroidobacteraceae bacterium]
MPQTLQEIGTAKGSLPLFEQGGVVACRQKVRKLAAELKFSARRQTMLVTAASELARNTVILGKGGMFSWESRAVPSARSTVLRIHLP